MEPPLKLLEGRRVLEFSEKVRISIEGRHAIINRPHLLGAIFIKSAALQNSNDTNPTRHLHDLALLTTMFSTEDQIKVLDKKSISTINSAMGKLNLSPVILAKIEGSAEGVDRLILALSN